MYEGDNTSTAHGVLLINSNAMDVVHSPIPTLTYRTIGEMLDFFIFMGPTAGQVIRQKANVVGLPAMPPYWSLGFHLSRYGYLSDADMRDTFYNNTAAGIPIDVQWADIEYQDDYNLFTIDQNKFAGICGERPGRLAGDLFPS